MQRPGKGDSLLLSVQEDTEKCLLPTRKVCSDLSAVVEKKTRWGSVDALRGLIMMVMTFNDYAYYSWAYLAHSSWAGITIADFELPTFIFVMGVSVGISYDRLRKIPKKKALLQTLRRSLTLIFLNLIYNGFYQRWDTKHLRIPGVLFRIGLCYGIVTTMIILLPTLKPNRKNQFKEVFEIAPLWCGGACIFCIWLLITYGMPVFCRTRKNSSFDFGRNSSFDSGSYLTEKSHKPVFGYTGAGGLMAPKGLEGCTAAAQSAIDLYFFGQNHIQRRTHVGCTSDKTIMCPNPVDDCGLLGTLPAVITTIIGVQAGLTILRRSSDGSRQGFRGVLVRFMIYAFLLGILATIMTGGHSWFDSQTPNGRYVWIPIVKTTWSPSFICAMACMDFLLLSFFFYMIDAPASLRRKEAKMTNEVPKNQKCRWLGQPFIWTGRNSVLIFLVTIMCYDFLPFCHPSFWQKRTMSKGETALICGVGGNFVWVFLAWQLHARKCFWVVGRERIVW